jgi:ATP-dependent RNA helicase DDX54/DBP10
MESLEWVMISLFEMGFEVQLHEILHRLPSPDERQTLFFSATLPKNVIEFAKAGLKPNPILVRLDSETKISKDLEMSFLTVKPLEKVAALLYLLRELISVPHKIAAEKSEKSSPQTIIFVSTKHHVEFLNALLCGIGYRVSYIYGSMDQSSRNFNLESLRSGDKDILIVTDVASRGIDIPILDHVVNFDFPPQSKVFVHRVGRVARAGRRGWAWSFLTNEEVM